MVRQIVIGHGSGVFGGCHIRRYMVKAQQDYAVRPTLLA